LNWEGLEVISAHSVTQVFCTGRAEQNREERKGNNLEAV
jgi:hypothetical protein